MIRSGNPALTEDRFAHLARDLASTGGREDVMTFGGVVNKTALALALCVIAAGFTWWRFYDAGPQAAMPLMWGGLIIGLVLGLATAFFARIAPYTTLPYAAAEGFFLGGISAIIENTAPQYSGVAFQAVLCTLGVFAIMLTLYATRIIKVTPKLVIGISAAIGGVFVFYLVAFVGSLFGWTGASQYLAFNNSSALSIGISVVIVGIAAFSLLLDFDMIERGVDSGAPKKLEWYSAFGLIVSLVWLYLEILRLLSKLRSR